MPEFIFFQFKLGWDTYLYTYKTKISLQKLYKNPTFTKRFY